MRRQGRQQSVMESISDAFDAIETINDDYGQPHKYEVRAWPAGHGLRLARQLTRLLGSAGMQALVGIANSDWDAVMSGSGRIDIESLDGQALSMAFVMLCDTLESYGDDALFRAILKGAMRDGVDCETRFDSLYSANYGELFRAVLLCLSVSYGPLLQGGWLAKALSRVRQPSPASSESVSSGSADTQASSR